MEASVTHHYSHRQIRTRDFRSKPKPEPGTETAKADRAEKRVRIGTFREETGDLLVKADIAAKNSFRTDCFSHRTYDARRDRRRAVGSGTTIIFLLEL